eukprot:5725452-Prymnesium_polylepis.1
MGAPPGCGAQASTCWSRRPWRKRGSTWASATSASASMRSRRPYASSSALAARAASETATARCERRTHAHTRCERTVRTCTPVRAWAVASRVACGGAGGGVRTARSLLTAHRPHTHLQPC